MPLPTGGPVITGVPPEQWAEILKALQQLGVTVLDLAQQGITTWEGAGGLKKYLINNGWEQIEFWELKTQWVHTGAGNATESNALVQYLANEITLAGAAGSQYVKHFSFGGSTISKLKKGVVFGAIFSLLVSSLDPSFITDTLKGRLGDVIDHFADENGDIPIVVGEDGKTYYHEDMINALRQALIDEGVYLEGFEPDYKEYPVGTTIPLQSVDFGKAIEIMRGHLHYTNIDDNWGFTDYTFEEADRLLKAILQAYNTSTPIRFNAGGQYEYTATPIKFNINGFARGGADVSKMIYNFIIQDSFEVTSTITYRNINAATGRNIQGVKCTDYSIQSPTITYEELQLFKFVTTGSIGNVGDYDFIPFANPYGAGLIMRVQINSNKYMTVKIPATYEYIGSGFTPAYVANRTTDIVTATEYTLNNSAGNYMTMRGYGKNRRGLVFNGKTGEGVEGITVASDLIDRGIGNISTALEDIFPSYATDKITTINPTDEDITASENWYPISSSDSDVWTDGITEQQSETATDGEVTPDIQSQIADAIKQILEDYYRDPTDPNVINYPEIETGDSGDTPPENPPLIPPSDVTGSNGLWSIYNPSMQNVNDFGAWLWSDSLADQFKRIFNSPIDGVIGFHMLYCTPSTGTAKPIKCGFLQSPVSAPVVTNPYVEIDCGTVSINEYYRNAMDYDNTRISVYLPFIGIVPLDTNIVMGSDINITYRVDVLTGTCLAQIKVIKENSDAVMYAFDGNCAVQIPLTATTYTGMIGALLGGISAGASIMTGNMVQAIGSGVRALASGMTGLSGAKQSGTFGANVGALGIRIPYVIITHPVSAMPGQFNKLVGIPSNNVVVLGSLSGYTRVRSVHLENIGKATQEELQMIQEQLESGVII